MRVGIFGSGFGLYGYLPALAKMGQSVVMPERYRAKLRLRPELRAFEQAVEWVADDSAVLERCASLVVSRRPADQVRDVERALARGTVERFILEKPLGPDPAAALSLYDLLTARASVVRIGFIFAYTPWAMELRDWIQGAEESGTLNIVWRFRAHHHATGRETWKRHHEQGGGVLRFFGIHVIALLAELGYSSVLDSIVFGQGGAADAWDGRFAGAGLPSCQVRIDSNADAIGLAVSGIGSHSTLDVALQDPFTEAAQQDGLDRRVDYLAELCRSFLSGAPSPLWYRRSLMLWAEAERIAAVDARGSGRDGLTFASLD